MEHAARSLFRNMLYCLYLFQWFAWYASNYKDLLESNYFPGFNLMPFNSLTLIFFNNYSAQTDSLKGRLMAVFSEDSFCWCNVSLITDLSWSYTFLILHSDCWGPFCYHGLASIQLIKQVYKLHTYDKNWFHQICNYTMGFYISILHSSYETTHHLFIW